MAAAVSGAVTVDQTSLTLTKNDRTSLTFLYICLTVRFLTGHSCHIVFLLYLQFSKNKILFNSKQTTYLKGQLLGILAAASVKFALISSAILLGHLHIA